MTPTQAAPPPRLRERYEQEILPALTRKFGYSTPMEAPRLLKITLNMGLGNEKQDKKSFESPRTSWRLIAGQHPNVRRARKSIASFKLREGMPVGVSVTLRRARMWEFLDRLTSIAVPRIRDFRGLNPRSFDGRGNYSMGVKEQLIFPEIDYDSVDVVRGWTSRSRPRPKPISKRSSCCSAWACRSPKRVVPARRHAKRRKRPKKRSSAKRRPGSRPRSSRKRWRN